MTARRPAGLGLVLFASGCAGGSPLLHPARTLPQGEVRAATGFSGNVALGPLADGLRNARAEAAANPNVPGAPGTDPTYAKGALVSAAVAPGIAPFVGARVGVGDFYEGGVSYTGRGARIDIRRGFNLGGGATLSVGAAGSGVFYGHQNGGDLPAVDLGQVHGYGADLPVLVGWTTPGEIYSGWIGARAGWEHIDISQLSSEPKTYTLFPSPISLSADRFFGGGVIGAAVGFRHVHVALELDVAYEVAYGSYNQTDAHIAGLTLVPASALWWRF